MTCKWLTGYKFQWISLFRQRPREKTVCKLNVKPRRNHRCTFMPLSILTSYFMSSLVFKTKIWIPRMFLSIFWHAPHAYHQAFNDDCWQKLGPSVCSARLPIYLRPVIFRDHTKIAAASAAELERKKRNVCQPKIWFSWSWESPS